MNGFCVSARNFLGRPASRILLATIVLIGSPFPFSLHLYATSVVALIDHANQRLIIAADCRVSRGLHPVSACKIIQEPDCTVAMAGLYEQRNTDSRR